MVWWQDQLRGTLFRSDPRSRIDISASTWTQIAHELSTNTTVKTLSCRYSQSIPISGIVALAHALEINTCVQHVDLQFCKLSDADVIAFANMLKINTSIISISFHDNLLTDECMAALADALRVNSTLKILNIGENGIGATGAKHLSDVLVHQCTLQSLILAHNPLGATGFIHVATMLCHNSAIEIITLCNTLNYQYEFQEHGRLPHSDAVQKRAICTLQNALKLNNRLHTVEITSNRFGDDGARMIAQALRHNTTLNELIMTWNVINSKFVDRMMYMLRKNYSITYLRPTLLDEIVRYRSFVCADVYV